MNFSHRLMEAMVRKGINQKELSEIASVPQGAISNYCNEKGMPSSEVLYRLSNALEVSMEWLISGETSRTKDPAPQDNHWRDRALKSEEKLKMLKSAMQGWLKKI